MDLNYKTVTAHLLCLNLYCTALLFLRGQGQATHPLPQKILKHSLQVFWKSRSGGFTFKDTTRSPV